MSEKQQYDRYNPIMWWQVLRRSCDYRHAVDAFVSGLRNLSKDDGCHWQPVGEDMLRFFNFMGTNFESHYQQTENKEVVGYFVEGDSDYNRAIFGGSAVNDPTVKGGKFGPFNIVHEADILELVTFREQFGDVLRYPIPYQNIYPHIMALDTLWVMRPSIILNEYRSKQLRIELGEFGCPSYELSINKPGIGNSFRRLLLHVEVNTNFTIPQISASIEQQLHEIIEHHKLHKPRFKMINPKSRTIRQLTKMKESWRDLDVSLHAFDLRLENPDISHYDLGVELLRYEGRSKPRAGDPRQSIISYGQYRWNRALELISIFESEETLNELYDWYKSEESS